MRNITMISHTPLTLTPLPCLERVAPQTNKPYLPKTQSARYLAMNSTYITETCPSAAGSASYKGDFVVALTLGLLHTALMVLAVILAYAQLLRTPQRG